MSISSPVRKLPFTAILLLMCASLVVCASAAQVALRAQPEKSTFNIELSRTGLLKFLGDDHIIAVTGYQCDVLFDEQNLLNSSIRITIRTASLGVMDPQLAAEKRAEVQKRMEGSEVLDIARYPEISFVSRRITATGKGRFRVEGDLKIRDTSRLVAVDVFLPQEAGIQHVRGEARIRQTSFGIEPVSAGGGTVKVKDEMKIGFDLVLVPVNP